MKVLVACEYSGRVRDAFIKQGHDALSCDLLPTDVEGPHYQGDVLDIVADGWDLMVAHPPCTYLAVSGARWFKDRIKNLPKLVPTNVVTGREQNVWKMPPGKNRWKKRSLTYQGIADAMADQWGSLSL